jgi:beta-glucosidase
MRRSIIILCCLVAVSAWAQPYLNYNLGEQERVSDLLSRLMLAEKVSLLRHNNPAIDRLNIDKYYFGNEALHGVCRPGRFTVFPQAIGLASMWNPALLQQVATAISDEARGRWTQLNWGRNQHDSASDLLSFFSPTVNMARDPRWGRTPETYGEDPLLTASNAVAFVRGMQGDNDHYVKCIATVKHFVANNIEENRSGISSTVSERDLREYYFVPYEQAVKKAHVQSVMSAYNALNGVPCSANKWLLTDVLRGDWGFDGYVVSDCSALSYDFEHHHYASSYEHSAQLSLKAGLDLECGDQVYAGPLLNAYNYGMVSMSEIDTAAYRVLRARMRLGLFDPISRNPYNFIQPDVVACAEHQQLAAEAARQSLVLLKNDGILPLDESEIHSIALVGLNAAKHEFGDYSGTPLNPPVSVLEGLLARFEGTDVNINYAPWVGGNSSYALVNADHFVGGIKMEYFNNPSLAGEPSAVTTTDFVYFDPANQPPNPMVPNAPMSIRWSGDFVAPATGRYMFASTSDDGCRLIVDGRVLIDQWVIRAATTDYASIGLQEGQTYHIVYEYFDNGGDAIATLKWRMPSTVTSDPLDAYGNAGKRIRESDLTIAVMGIDRSFEREGQDRNAIELPKEQSDFLKLAYAANPRMVVVFVAGSPLVDTWAAENIPAMLYAWYPGEQGGTAVVEALFGDYNPAGRLPITFYRSTADLPPFDDYELANGRTYMYYEQQPLYPFGHGLSYTTFEYNNLALNQANDTLHVSFDVTNTGTRAGDEVPQVYLRYPSLRRPLPIKQLHGFERIATQPGQTLQVNIPVALADLRLWDDSESKFVTPQGDYAVMVGASSQDIRLQSMFHLGDNSGVITEIEGVTVDAMGSQLRVSSLDHPVDMAVFTPDGRKVTSQAHLLGTQFWTLDAGIYVIVVADGHHPTRAFKVLIK